MAYSAVTNVLYKVLKLLVLEDNLTSDATDELKQFPDYLCLLRSCIEEASRSGKKDESLIEVERKIMEVAYDAEDTIDSYLTELKTTAPRAFTMIRRSLAENSLRPMLDNVRHLSRDLFGVGVDDRTEITIKLSPLIRQENVIGFQDEETKIIKFLRETSKELDVMSIIGMAGMGKTTLARKIFMSKEMSYEFPICIWVYASRMFDRRAMFLEILKHYDSVDRSGLSTEELGHNVNRYLDEGFMLVIDDLCSVTNWDDIHYVLPRTTCMKGKVLITSRYTVVGRHASRTREPLHLGFLTEEQSWELLQYEVFGSLRDCPRELMGIREYVAKQCGGLPLAIRHIGRKIVQILASREEMSEMIGQWYTISENLKLLNYEMEQRVILDIVASSYNALPHSLRDCFLYMGMFPENYEIRIRTLINLWIAEGFIEIRRAGMSLEETAEEYLMDLVSRNVVMVDKTNLIGKVKTCRLHPLMHAFCRSRAAITELNFFHEIKMSNRGTLEPPSNVQNYYRLSIHSHLLEFLSKKPRNNHLRSLLCFDKKPVILDSECISAIADAFCLLRVLATDSVKINQFPKNVTRLAHLSYISLCGDDLEIPEELSKLQNLQTIVVDTKSVSLTIKANIWRMALLKLIRTKSAIILDIIQGKEGNAGENLQTLSRLSPESCTVDVFNRTINLKKLGIRGRLDTLDAQCLRTLNGLENLKLVNDSLLSEKSSQHQLQGLPHSALSHFPVNLKRLTLSATYLSWDHMSTLGMISTLEILKLTNYAFIGELWSSAVDPGFGSLYLLVIASTDLILWEASANDFPNLSYLALKNCENLKKIPMGLAKSLRKLDIENLPVSAVESARKIEQEKANEFKLLKANEFKLSVRGL